jgi:dTDP-4-dehydrorhamnose reductase
VERWLITGASGLVGGVFLANASRHGVELVAISRTLRPNTHLFDLQNTGLIGEMLDLLQPQKVVHFAAMARPAEVEMRKGEAELVNVAATRAIADWCLRNRRHITTASTDWVFDGAHGPYSEADPPKPATLYGQMKLRAEEATLAANGLVVRLGWVLNDTSSGRDDFIRCGIRLIRAGQTVGATNDELRTPVAATEAVSMIGALVDGNHRGVFHVAGASHATPFQLLRKEVKAIGLDTAKVVAAQNCELSPDHRPRDVRLATDLVQRVLHRKRQAMLELA